MCLLFTSYTIRLGVSHITQQVRVQCSVIKILQNNLVIQDERFSLSIVYIEGITCTVYYWQCSKQTFWYTYSFLYFSFPITLLANVRCLKIDVYELPLSKLRMGRLLGWFLKRMLSIEKGDVRHHRKLHIHSVHKCSTYGQLVSTTTINLSIMTSVTSWAQ